MHDSNNSSSTDLISVFQTKIGDYLVQTCNARELWAKLGVKKHFRDWIKLRISEYGFAENSDFVRVFSNAQNSALAKKGGSPKVDYHITLDMAKELAMVEKNPVGRQIRKYFIQCEKDLRESQRMVAAYVRHTKRDVQVENSKAINSKLKTTGGKSAVIVYNVANCKVQSGKPPKYWKNIGKADCLPTRVSQSAKEVLRVKHPQVACGMSLSDQLVMNGIDMTESISIGKDSQAIFKRILDNGLIPSELLM